MTNWQNKVFYYQFYGYQGLKNGGSTNLKHTVTKIFYFYPVPKSRIFLTHTRFCLSLLAQ
ncbi:MAG: hypothetical protein EAY75_15375 [Bacteroidetes bacterium]|nr:MAG: hypothetical protein EAY75_15375 [Bacteroidota bacterium]